MTALEKGTNYQISPQAKGHLNSASVLTIISCTANIVQFKLENKKGHGSMPIEHFEYLLKKKELILNKQALLLDDSEEEKIC